MPPTHLPSPATSTRATLAHLGVGAAIAVGLGAVVALAYATGGLAGLASAYLVVTALFLFNA